MQREDWKEKFAEYFTFSLNERWAILVLVMLILFLFIAPGYFSDPGGTLLNKDSLIQRAIADIDSATAEHQHKKKIKFKTLPKKEYQSVRFIFDPNTITIDDLIRLGVK